MRQTIIAVIGLLMTASIARGAGFQNPVSGAAAAGQAGAFTAQADDASAVTHNPAGLTQLEKDQVLVTFSFISPSVKHITPLGVTEKAKGSTHQLPGFYWAAAPSSANPVRFGLGISIPYGQSTRWSENSSFRYTGTFSEMELLNVNPAVAFQVNPRLSVGLGLNYYSGRIKLEALDPYFMMGFPDGSHQLKADGEQWGYNLGLLYRVAENQSLGFAYRGGFPMTFKGDLKMRNLPVPLGGPTYSTPARLDLDYPALVNLGYAWRPRPDLKLEFDLEWTNWSVMDRVPVDFAYNTPFLPDQSTLKDWNDTLSPRLGLEYQAGSNARWRAGYLFLPSPIPDRTYEAGLPDADSHIFNLGFEWKGSRFRLAISQSLSLPEKRRILQGGPYDGEYRAVNHITTVNLGYDF